MIRHGIFILLFLLFASSFVFAQDERNFGLGVRIGDPTGITFKTYFLPHALEINLGRTNMWGLGWHPSDRFRTYPRFDGYEYRSHRYSTPLSLQVHYLLHRDFPVIENLDWYYGAGGQARMYTARYYYRYREGPGNPWRERHEEFREISLGVDGVLGLEYTLPDLPFSFMLDATLHMELYRHPFYLWTQGGIGMRYNF